MTDLVPLLQQDLPPGTHALLDSASDDAPRAGSRDTLLLKLGVGAAALGAAATGVTASSASAVAGSAGKTLSGGITTLVAKWLGLGAVVGTLASSAAFSLSSRDLPQRPIAVAPRTGAEPVPPPVQSRERAEQPPAAPAASSARPSLAGSAPAATVTSQQRSSRMAAELAHLDQARVLVARGNASAALEQLTRYAREFPDGALRPEATLLRLDALRAAGNDAAAAALARRFLADHAASPHAERVRALLQRIDTARPAATAPTGAGQLPGAAPGTATDSGINGNVGRFPAASNL